MAFDLLKVSDGYAVQKSMYFIPHLVVLGMIVLPMVRTKPPPPSPPQCSAVCAGIAFDVACCRHEPCASSPAGSAQTNAASARRGCGGQGQEDGIGPQYGAMPFLSRGYMVALLRRINSMGRAMVMSAVCTVHDSQLLLGVHLSELNGIASAERLVALMGFKSRLISALPRAHSECHSSVDTRCVAQHWC
jgi:hypothetical protein